MPALSIVLTGRNDNHSAGFAERLFTVLESNIGLLNRHEISFEIVWVEWNAVPDQPLLAASLRTRFPEARAIVVSPDIHNSLIAKPQLKFLQYFAKNAGLRRAEAPFILVSNSDILLAESTVEEIGWIVHQPPEPAIYRATRRDLKPGIEPAHASDPAGWERLNLTTPPYHVEQSGDFILASRRLWWAMKGFNENIRDSELHVDSQFCVQAYQSGLDVRLIGDVYHLYHQGSWIHLSASQRSDAGLARGVDFDYMKALPYANGPDWGLTGYAEDREDERTVRLRLNRLADANRPRARHDEDAEHDPLWQRAHVNLGRRSPVDRDLAGLKQHLRDEWTRIGHDPSCRSKGIALYGAGRYTEWLLNLVEQTPGPRVCVILDDYVHSDCTVHGIRVVAPATLTAADVGAVVISSDVYEDVLAKKSEALFGPEMRVIRLHQNLPKGLYLLDH